MKRLTPTAPLDASALTALVVTLRRAHPRAVAVLAAAWVDDALQEFLLSRLVDTPEATRGLMEPRGPLSDFSARIKLAFALGFIGADLRDDLDTIRVLRNGFAHLRDPLSFSDPRVREACGRFNTVLVFGRHSVKPLRGPKIAYLFSAVAIAQFLLFLSETPRRPNAGIVGLAAETTRGIPDSTSLESILVSTDRVKRALHGV